MKSFIDERPAVDRGARRRLLRGLCAALCGSATAWQHAEAAAAAAATPAADTSFYASFKGAQLLDQEGRALDLLRLRGRTVLVNFIFTGCSTACPMQTRALAEMQGQLAPALRPRVHLLSVSLDPLSDTPQTLKAFARRMGADLSGWTFATGRPPDIERISDTLRLYRPLPEVRKPDDHSTALWLLDRLGQVRMRYAGNPPDVPRLLREIAALDQLTREPRSR